MADLSDLPPDLANGIFPTFSLAQSEFSDYVGRAMENELRENLLRCAAVYAEAKEIGLSTLGRLAAGDWRFFDNLSKDDKTFTARKYDEVVQWFSNNWPSERDWPADLMRPEAAQPEHERAS